MFRLKPTEGERLFLDTRDLIGVIEKSSPVSARDLAEVLVRRNARVVLVYTNVAELVPQTDLQKPNRRRVRSIMEALEQIPHAYLRSPEISRFEFREAVAAFETGKPVRPASLYVTQWWETFWKVPPEYMRFLKPAQLRLLRQLSLPVQVEILLNTPECLRFDDASRVALHDAVEDDRKRLGTSRGSAKSFLAGVKNLLIRFRWPEPNGGIEAFSEFVRGRSDVCPGWRISHDVYEEFRCNLTAPAKKGDIPDFSHISILPYVSHATLDRAWRTRCAQTRDRMVKAGLAFTVYDRVYPDLAAILRTW